jgi:hypothetical protein
MKRLIFFILVMIVTSSGAAFGQVLETEIKVRRPDFSGKWVYNHKESGPESSKIPARAYFKIFCNIQQDSSKITITTTSDPVVPELPASTETIYTDGRVYDLFPQMLERGFTATILWEKGKLVKRIFDKAGKFVHRNEIELIANGKQLRFYGWHTDSLGRIYEEFQIFDRVQQ